MEQEFIDEMDCGNFFDQIDDLIEFPPENELGDGGSLIGPGDAKAFPSIWSETLLDSDPMSNPILSDDKCNAVPDLSAELSVPYEDIVQLEWLSTFMDDSFSAGDMTLDKENSYVNNAPAHSQFQTSSPISVLESSSTSSNSSCSGGKSMPHSPTKCSTQRARSKRPRPSTFSPRAGVHLISPSSSFIETPQMYVSSEYENFAESQPMKKIEQKKKKKIQAAAPVDPTEMVQNPPPQAVRKCLHCEITKTPQWRAGPLGPKTLCNACGVRYKSGRLFPEYRPAASPTFVPSVHSNSHKKVLEMRSKPGSETVASSLTNIKPENVANASQ